MHLCPTGWTCHEPIVASTWGCLAYALWQPLQIWLPTASFQKAFSFATLVSPSTSLCRLGRCACPCCSRREFGAAATARCLTMHTCWLHRLCWVDRWRVWGPQERLVACSWVHTWGRSLPYPGRLVAEGFASVDQNFAESEGGSV